MILFEILKNLIFYLHHFSIHVLEEPNTSFNQLGELSAWYKNLMFLQETTLCYFLYVKTY